MTRSTRGVAHRRGPAAAALVVAALALAAGCSTGQQTQTDATVPAVPGTNRQVDAPGGSLAVRNVVVVYPGAGGYRKGAAAALDVRLFNDTDKPVRLVGVTSPNGRVVLAAGTNPASPTGSPSPSRPAGASPSASPTPPPAGTPVNVEVPAGGFVVLSPGAGRFLQLVGLTDDLLPGESVTVTFQFHNGAAIQDVSVPLNTPLSPLPRSPMPLEQGEEGHG